MAYNTYPYTPNYGTTAYNPYIQTMQRMSGMYPEQNYNMNQSQQMSPGQDIPFVDGYEGAKMYPIPAGKQYMLMDSREPKFYIKKLDNQGYPIISVFEFKTAEPTQNNVIESNINTKSEDFLSKGDFDNLLKNYEMLKNDYEQFKNMVFQVASQLPIMQTNQENIPQSGQDIVVNSPIEKTQNEKGGKK